METLVLYGRETGGDTANEIILLVHTHARCDRRAAWSAGLAYSV